VGHDLWGVEERILEDGESNRVSGFFVLNHEWGRGLHAMSGTISKLLTPAIAWNQDNVRIPRCPRLNYLH
jgi:hypothetical protein